MALRNANVNVTGIVNKEVKRLLKDKKRDSVMGMDQIVVESTRQRIEITAEDFGLLDDENQITFRPITLDELECNISNMIREDLERDRARNIILEQDRASNIIFNAYTRLDALCRNGTIQCYDNLQFMDGILSFDMRPTYPAQYMTLEIQL